MAIGISILTKVRQILAKPETRAGGIPRRRDIAFIALFLLSYIFARYVGTLIFAGGNNLAMFWPASGVFVAALLLSRYRLWPALVISAIVFQLSYDLLFFGEDISYALMMTVANSSEALIGAFLIRHVVGSKFDESELTQVLSIGVLAAGVGAAVSATIGVLAISMRTPDIHHWQVWQSWWASNALGIILITPLVIFCLRPSGQSWSAAYAGRRLEILVLFLGLLASAQFVYGAEVDSIRIVQDIPYIGLPLLLWLVIRFDARLTASVMLALTVIIVINVKLGRGPFASLGYLDGQTLFSPQIFLAVRASALLVVSAVVSERRRIEERLRQSREQLEEALTLANMVSFEVDIATGEISLSNSFWRLIDRRPETVEPGFKGFLQYVHPDDIGIVTGIYEKSRFGGEGLEADFRIVLPSGEVRLLHQIVKIVFDESGKPSKVKSTLQDVTERTRLEEQLRQAQKMEVVGQLTGGVAHEFNNLLMVILGNIEALGSRMKKDDPLQSFASSAMKGVHRGAELTQSLLAFSRKQRLESGQVDLNGLVIGTQELFQRTLGETITIKTDLAENLWNTSADSGQIEAALLNFVLNARDAMPDGGTIVLRTSNWRITADLAAHHDGVRPGDYIALEVSDTGTGMTERQIEHAFEPFYTTKEVGEGTGLGLSVAFGFAKQSGGYLEIKSEPGEGTTLRLSLPRAVEEGVAAEGKQERPAEAATGSGSGSGKIIVVEDDADVRALVVSQLTDLGYEVVEAEDGPAMLALLAEDSEVDLLFSDVVLPGGMSGPEAAKEAHRDHPRLKVLFTSGYPEKDVEDLSVDGKDVAILSKPYRKAELAAAIAAAMKSG